ncbi:hypothetical protein [Plebeiibacterium sediminum]|uniref:Uncharacterized protein n=1 Tax=Plebeiibacterium sediminum TaxID=2992112 RepID=A0AAE3SHK6_9BACT|nr:hypothetical protein [Plebeiobacterium sediminum]MCW3789526.1 hypothetical protein [Plebeiobacterium sediminum]
MVQRILNITTDKLIGILFIPWILLIIIPLTPSYKQLFDSMDVVLLILWIQLGMLFIASYSILIFLNNTVIDSQTNSKVFIVHSIVNYLLCTLWFGLAIFSSANSFPYHFAPLLILVLIISELMRLRVIAKLLVSIEQNKAATFKDYFLTLILLSGLFGVWNIHQRLKSIYKRKTTAANNT